MVYVELKRAELRRDKWNAAAKNAVKHYGEEDGKNSLLFDSLDDKTEIDQIENDGTLNVMCNSDLGYFSFHVTLTDEDFIRLLEIAMERMKKYKTILEASKA